MTLIHKIIEVIKQSDHEVVLPLVHVLLEPPIASPPDAEINADGTDDYYVNLVKNWIDELQEMYDKAERFDDVENNMYWISDHVDEIESTISHIRNYIDV